MSEMLFCDGQVLCLDRLFVVDLYIKIVSGCIKVRGDPRDTLCCYCVVFNLLCILMGFADPSEKTGG